MFLRRVATSALVVALLSVLGLCGNSVAWTREQAELAYNNSNLIRLHIIANSDSAVDQRIKLRVRDALIAEAKRLFVGVQDPKGALNLVRTHEKGFAALAAKTAKAAGASYGAYAESGVYSFPARIYPFGSLPAGEYQALRIVLGRGGGKNWWCVLFPPLCFLAPETEPHAGPVRVRLLFLERLLRQNGLAFDAFWQGWAKFWRLLPDDSSKPPITA